MPRLSFRRGSPSVGPGGSDPECCRGAEVDDGRALARYALDNRRTAIPGLKFRGRSVQTAAPRRQSAFDMNRNPVIRSADLIEDVVRRPLDSDNVPPAQRLQSGVDHPERRRGQDLAHVAAVLFWRSVYPIQVWSDAGTRDDQGRVRSTCPLVCGQKRMSHSLSTTKGCCRADRIVSLDS